jgi:hypothetical protein
VSMASSLSANIASDHLSSLRRPKSRSPLRSTSGKYFSYKQTNM